jgi:hypothetical protein
VTAIAAGVDHSLALKGDGTVVAWGCGAGTDFGQCSVPSGLAGVIAVAAGYAQSLALRGDGSVVAWGCGAGTDSGQCSMPSGLAGVTAIAAGLWHSLAVAGPFNQTITFGSIPDKNFGEPAFGVSATASSGLPVFFAASGNCTAIGRFLHLSGPGLCTVTASQPGDADYNPAPDVSQTFAIASPASPPSGGAKAGQSISFVPLPGKTYGDPDFTVSATASSGLAVSFAASGSCILSGATVRLAGAGACMVTASQAGDANYSPASAVSQIFAIARASQSITFGPLARKSYGAPNFGVSATASSGLAVSFAASGSCIVSGATVHLAAAGSCTVTASQPGDANYNPAPDVSRTFSITRAPCRVPKVVGTKVASAKRAIATRHCRTGRMRYAYSPNHKKNIVISQSRRPGLVLTADSKINLTVSRGRKR